MYRDFDDYTIASLTTAIEQIKKGNKIAEMDEKISTLIDDATELLYDVEQFQDDIVDQIARATRYMELCTAKPHQRSPTSPRVTSQLDLGQPQLENVNPSVVESATGSTLSVVESELGSVSTSVVQTVNVNTIMGSSNNTLPVTTSNTTVPLTAIISQTTTNHITEICSADNTMLSLPINTMIYSTSLGPPPLIPATSQNMSGLISPQRPITSTLFVPHSLSIARSQVFPNLLINTSTVSASQGMYESSIPLPQHSFTTPVMPMHPTVPSHQSQMFATSRLPKLTLITFSGDPLTWQTFLDSFYVAIHGNPNLSGIQKFNYLKPQLQGDAARTIAGLPLTDPNYQHAITPLQERYGQHHKIVNAHMQALLEMSSPSNSLSSLRIFYDTVESHIRGLSSLGKSEHSYGDLLIPIIMGKLTTEIQRNLARERSNSPWNLPDLMAAILKEIQILECGQ